jgi:hypothetical protein
VERGTLSACFHGDGGICPVMAYENAKLLLQQAGTFSERAEAVRRAIALGMPLSEIEQYLDWLDQTEPPQSRSDEEQAGNSAPE